MEKKFRGFPRETLRLLRELKANNNRKWFLAHKTAFEEKVKAPMMELVESLGTALQIIAPELIVDPKRAIYRIYRDVRFSADKSPYKTQIAALFPPRGLPKHAGASLYFHIAPEEILIAGGIYMPGSAELRAIRSYLVDHHRELLRIINAKEFKKIFGRIEGQQLACAPKGFPPDHPAIDLIRYKQYLAEITEKPHLAESPELFPLLLKCFALMIPFIRFLNAPLLSRSGIRTGGPPV
jgi:uncharacterized protein (TIGR02453 family)